MKKYLFTDQEKENIKAAVKALEKESCGEIVPFFARSSDSYEEASWRVASILGAGGLVVVGALSFSWNLPSITVLEICIGIIGLMILGYLIPLFFPVLKRLILSKERLLEGVERGARDAFLSEKVYATEEKVGILIYVSRLEHIVIVIGDEGINQKVSPEDWNQVISFITQGLKKKEIGNGLVRGIDHCKKLLLNNGFIRKESDFNELSNELRIKE